MKNFGPILLSFLLVFGPVFARGGGHSSSGSHSSGGEVHVRGYTKKDGTYVAPHERTAPNGTKNDNWSTKGNVNPYTEKPGTKPRDEEYTPPAAGSVNSVSPATTRSAIPAQALKTSQPVIPAVTKPRAFPKGWAGPGMTRMEVLKSMGVPKEKIGDSWIYDNRTIHWSSTGLST